MEKSFLRWILSNMCLLKLNAGGRLMKKKKQTKIMKTPNYWKGENASLDTPNPYMSNWFVMDQ